MAALASETTLNVSYPRHRRFFKGNGWELHGLSLSSDGKIIVSGFHYNGKTFFDVYSASRDNPKIIYSREFDKYSDKPYQNVSFYGVDSAVILCCVSNKLELLRLKLLTSAVTKSRTLHGEIRSLAVIDGEIFLGISGSNRVFVFNGNLDEVKSITLEGIESPEYSWDMTIVKHTLFVITRLNGSGKRALSYGKEKGNILTEFKNTVRQNPLAESIAVSVTSGLVAVLWNRDQIIFYPFSENKPLLVFPLVGNVRRIRISEEGSLVSGSIAGEIHMYDLEQLFSFDAMKRTLTHIISSDDCGEIQSYFGVSMEEMIVTEAGSEYENLKRKEGFLTTFEEGGHFNPWNITNLRNALETLGDEMRVSILKGPIEGYARYGKCRATTIENLEAEMKTKNRAWKIEKLQLNDEINQLKGDHEKALKTVQLEQDKIERQFAEEVNLLEKKLKDAENKCHVERMAHNQTEVKNPTTELEAEFGKLIVGIAEHLTLDDALKIAKLFNLPESTSDFLRSVSIQETPGMKLLKLVLQRSIINIYDVTNLQKAFEILRLDMINNDLVTPYQLNIDDKQYELHKLREMFTWKDLTVLCDSERDSKAICQMNSTKTSSEGDASEDVESKTYEEVTTQDSYDSISTPKGRSNHSFHAEGIIGNEGGTIQLADIYLTIPPGAILDGQVISLDVINEPPASLSTEVDNTRMTPLVKLEPLGLILNKPLQLTIPHFAHMQLQEQYDVVIHAGEISDQSSVTEDKIMWSEKRCLSTKLQERSVTVDVQCLTYLFASIVSNSSTSPLYIIRVVSFIDGMRNANDDIILTICFCKDNDVEYNNLLSDYKTKLPLEQYSTLNVRLLSQRNSGDEDYISVTISSVKNTYLLDSDKAVKRISVAHICAASRVSHQIRLKRDQDADNDMIDVKLIIFQDNGNKTECFLKARIKDLMISQESENILLDFQPPVFQPYERLKMTIASMLETSHCCTLATYFELTRAEVDMVQNDEAPGRMLMKILDEREKIMPQKMSYLFHGLKFCHLDKIARIVLLYIEEHSRQTTVAKHPAKPEDENEATDNINANGLPTQYSLNKLQHHHCRTDQSVQTDVTAISLSNSALDKTLTQQGCNKSEVHISNLQRNCLIRSKGTVEWIKKQKGLMSYILLMSLDGLLQIKRGILTLPSQFDF